MRESVELTIKLAFEFRVKFILKPVGQFSVMLVISEFPISPKFIEKLAVLFLFEYEKYMFVVLLKITQLFELLDFWFKIRGFAFEIMEEFLIQSK